MKAQQFLLECSDRQTYHNPDQTLYRKEIANFSVNDIQMASYIIDFGGPRLVKG